MMRVRWLAAVMLMTALMTTVGCSQQAAPATKQAASKESAAAPGAAPKPAPINLKAAFLALPSMVPPVLTVIKAEGLDKKNDLDLKLVPVSEISALYASIATGEADTLMGGPHALQRMSNQGVPIQGFATFLDFASTGLVTSDPAVKSITDLKGKTLAADMGASEFLVFSIYAKTQGLDLLKDVTVVQANPVLARTQLQAGRAAAAMFWEPNLTLALTDNPNYRIFVDGRKAWGDTTGGKKGWEMVVFLRRDTIQKDPKVVERWLKTLQDAASFIKNDLDKADAIAAKDAMLPPGILKKAVQSGRLGYDVRPLWAKEEAEATWEMFRAAVYSGFLGQLPKDDIIYTPK